MDSKDKAKELIAKYSTLVTTWDCYWDTPRNPDDILADAKKCAIFLVEQLLEAQPSYRYWGTYDDETPSAITFWNEVKTELEVMS